MRATLDVDPDIRRASTPPAWFYTDPAVFDEVRERIFVRSWQLLADTERLKTPGQTLPTVLLEGLIDEPVVLTRDTQDALHCFSNVCTHRASLVVEGPAVESGLRCRYHGRRFALDGRFVSMPEFESAQDFPSPADDLKKLAVARWRNFVFASLDPAVPLGDVLSAIEERCGWLPFAQAVLDPARSRDYVVHAHWALYCENYLEGFHIPYVHASLNQGLDYAAYRTELHRHSSLQIGEARGGEDVFEVPASSPDRGRRIAAYYFWLFPNLMLNLYPWGVSVNVVKPIAPDRTRVSFLSYVWDRSRLDRGAGAELDRVEREDEAVVESVQKGMASRLYRRGRYSPAREQGVHHFHRLLAERLDQPI